MSEAPLDAAQYTDGVGHVPFLEEPERFNRELARFARKAHDQD
jgi:pimeloyl-ACP methyl ester carboxylesterase